MKDEVELADILKAAIESFDEDLDEIEDAELTFGLIDAEDEREGGVVAVDDAHVRAEDGAALNEVAQSLVAT